MDLNMRNIVIGAVGTVSLINQSGVKPVFFSFAKGVDPVTKLDEFGTHENDIFYHANYEKELKELMKGKSDQFLLLDYELSYLYGAHAPSPYRYVVSLMNQATDDWDDRFFPDSFDDAEGWSSHLISWDIELEVIKNTLAYFSNNPAVRTIDINVQWLSVYDKTNQANALITSFHLLELSRTSDDGEIDAYIKFDVNGVTHAYNVSDVIKQALEVSVL